MKAAGITLPMMAIMVFTVASVFTGNAVTKQLGTAVQDSFPDLERMNKAQHQFDSTYVDGVSMAAYHSTNQVTYENGKNGGIPGSWNNQNIDTFLQQVRANMEDGIRRRLKNSHSLSPQMCSLGKQPDYDVDSSRQPLTVQVSTPAEIQCSNGELPPTRVEKQAQAAVEIPDNRYLELGAQVRNYLRSLDNRLTSNIETEYTSTTTACESDNPQQTARENSKQQLNQDLSGAHGTNKKPSFYSFPDWVEVKARSIVSREVSTSASSTKVGCCTSTTKPSPGDQPPQTVCEDDRVEATATSSLSEAEFKIHVSDSNKRVLTNQGWKKIGFKANSYTQSNFN